ncbi:hypothetical protein [Pedobacter quisquiliarum]|nr:hypothetical protein [Pedobacter quisquiliarum]
MPKVILTIRSLQQTTLLQKDPKPLHLQQYATMYRLEHTTH